MFYFEGNNDKVDLLFYKIQNEVKTRQNSDNNEYLEYFRTIIINRKLILIINIL